MAKKEQAEGLNKAQVVREAIEKVGLDAAGPDIRAEVLKKHPELAEFCASGAFTNYVSTIKKKLRGGTSAAPAKKPQAAPVAFNGGLATQLESLKGLVDVFGKEELKKVVDIL